jgi:peptidoglycan/xylan/chitin deacetylase (PgdA/CDA1 family)
MIHLSVDVEPDFPPYINTLKGIDGLRRITTLLKDRDSDATFFVTAEVIAKKPGIANLIKDFEVGCHGLRHIDYTQIPLQEFERELSKAVRIMNSHGLKPTGFRAPYAKINGGMLQVVGKYFMYDSSKPFYKARFMDVEEIPIYTGGRVFGVHPVLFDLLLKVPLENKVFFIHPWEYGGLDFSEVMSRRRNLRFLGYSRENYLTNLDRILVEGSRRLSDLI